MRTRSMTWQSMTTSFFAYGIPKETRLSVQVDKVAARNYCLTSYHNHNAASQTKEARKSIGLLVKWSTKNWRGEKRSVGEKQTRERESEREMGGGGGGGGEK